MKGVVSISGALAFGIVLVASAFYLSSENQTAAAISPVEVVDVPTREYIPNADADGDGVSDWEEQFGEQITVTLPETTPEEEYEPPQTLTGQYALRLFNNLMHSSKGGELSEAEQLQLIQNTLPSVVPSVKPRTFTTNDLLITEATEATVREYGNKLAYIILRYDPNNRTHELDVLYAALKGAPGEFEKLQQIQITYQQAIQELLLLQVPQTLVSRHLQVLNYTQSVNHSIGNFDLALEDPLLTLGHVDTYNTNWGRLLEVVGGIYDTIFKNGIRYTDDEPAGVLFTSLGYSS